MNKEEFVKEQMKLSKEDIIANYWYTYQDNVERLGIEHQLKLKDKEIERLNNIIKEANEKIHNIGFNVSSKEHNLYLKLDETYQGKELLALLEIAGVDKDGNE